MGDCLLFTPKKFMDFNKAYNLLSEKLESWLEALILILPNFVLALLILICFFFLAKGIRALIVKYIPKVSHIDTINQVIATITYVVVICVGLFIALDVLQLDTAVTSVLASAGIIGLALAFAFQDIAANFIAGIILSFRRPFEKGHIIESQDYMGVVQSINLRTTTIHTFTGQKVMIPNKDVFQNPMTNYTSTHRRRVDLEVGVSYGDDLEKVKKVTIAAVEKLEGISKNDEVSFIYTEFGDSSINFTVRMWAEGTEQPKHLKLKSDAIMAIKSAFDENDIMIPFPIRTLDFGIKGGEKLSELMDLNGIGKKDNPV
jgi:small conductance mechanosensitive channel